MLVRTPAPMPTESLFGYVLRVSETNGYDTPRHILNYAGYDKGSMRSSLFAVDKLAKILGRKPSELEGISYSSGSESGHSFKVLTHDLGICLPKNFLRLTKPTFCPHCVKNDKFIDIFWDLYFSVACPLHRCQVLSHCPACKEDLHWLRPGLLICHCGVSLFNTSLKSANNGVIELMAIMKAKLHYVSILTLPNTLQFPLQELENQSLYSFVWIISRLGSYSFFSKGIEETKDPYQTIQEVSEILSDWPCGYHRFLNRLGMKLTDGGNPSSSGLRKQFENFFVSTFKHQKNTYVDTKFLRDEFVAFGLRSWGKAIVDNKLLTNTETDTENRFYSKSKIADEVGISPVTLRNWLEKGLVPCKKVLVGGQVRYILDAELINLTKKAPGKTMDNRKAAAQAQIPVSVLMSLKESGHFIIEHLPEHIDGFHEADLYNFFQQLLEKSTMITLEKVNQDTCVSLDYILQEKRFWSKKGKATFVAAYLDGEIPSIGRTGDSLKQIWFLKDDVEISVSTSRAKSCDITVSQQEAAETIACVMDAIPVLITNGYLIGLVGPNRIRVKLESIKAFSTRYISFSSLSKKLNTSPVRLLKLCQNTEIDTLSLETQKGHITSFIEKEKIEILIKQIKLHPTRTDKRKVAVQNHVTSLEKLKQYFDNLRESGDPLPRRKLTPNKYEIAKATGVARNLFYDNPESILMLEAFDQEERLRIGIKSWNDMESLHHYLENLKKSNSLLPVCNNGKPNKLKIALACGINRNIFYLNPEASAMLDNYLKTNCKQSKEKQMGLKFFD